MVEIVDSEKGVRLARYYDLIRAGLEVSVDV